MHVADPLDLKAATARLETVEARWKERHVSRILASIGREKSIDESDIAHAEQRADNDWPKSDMRALLEAVKAVREEMERLHSRAILRAIGARAAGNGHAERVALDDLIVIDRGEAIDISCGAFIEYAPNVHNHGPEEGPGLACRESVVDGRLRGACMAGARSVCCCKTDPASLQCDPCLYGRHSRCWSPSPAGAVGGDQ